VCRRMVQWGVVSGVVLGTLIVLARPLFVPLCPAGPENSRSEFKLKAIWNALRAFLGGFLARLWPRQKIRIRILRASRSEALDVEREGF
ncbi:hypothetical protein, partial [Streptomyces laurentii]|uniref:hypothetical protein n=1 Tax=Streptomyces laurentii TaxID=39478 RepID=UPI0033E64DA1